MPLEFISNILVRPVTLALRLFANMFAGHLLLILFALGGEYLLFEYSGCIGVSVGILAWVMVDRDRFLEMLIQFLQAYVFTLLTPCTSRARSPRSTDHTTTRRAPSPPRRPQPDAASASQRKEMPWKAPST